MPHRLGSRPIALALTLVVVGSLAWTAASQNQPAGSAKRVLVFSGTGWFRHPEIPQTDGWLARVLGDAGIPADISETPKDLTPARLKGYQVLILNNANELTTLLDEKQRPDDRGLVQGAAAASSPCTRLSFTKRNGSGSTNWPAATSTAIRISCRRRSSSTRRTKIIRR